MLTGVILAGGKGERFGDSEKCLAPVCGVPLLFRVAGALAQVVDKLYVATTPRHRGVAEAAARWGIDVIYTPGIGYGHDFALLAAYAPAVVAACDIADLTPSHMLKLTAAEVFATATSGGEYVGLSYIPTPDLSRWVEVEVGPLRDVDTRGDLAEAERLCPVAYPLYVDLAALKPHEEVLEERRYAVVHPIAVDYKTAVVLDGHHRLRFLLRAGLPAPVLLFDYDAVDVNIDKCEVVRRAYAGDLFPPKTTWHTYRGRHVSEIPAAPAEVEELRRRPRLKPRRLWSQ